MPDEMAEPAKRPETGPMQFGDDWPGVFIRGDNAFVYAHVLGAILQDPTMVIRDPLGVGMPLDGLRALLMSSVATVPAHPDLQLMLPFEACMHKGVSRGA